MTGLIHVLRRGGGAAWTLALPTLLVLAGLGAGFALVPDFWFDESLETAEERPPLPEGGLNDVATGATTDYIAINGGKGWAPSRAVWFHWRSPADPSDADRPHRLREPAPELRVIRSFEERWETTTVSIGLPWLAGWVAGLTLIWGLWAWRVGRFVSIARERRLGRRATLARAARPWIVGLAALAALCLAASVSPERGGRLMAELRRVTDVPQSRSLFLFWTQLRTMDDAATAEAAALWDDPSRPLWGGPGWGFTASRFPEIVPVYAGSPEPDPNESPWVWSVVIRLWWLALPPAVWSAVSLWRSRRGNAAE